MKASVASSDRRRRPSRSSARPLVEVKGLYKSFPNSRRHPAANGGRGTRRRRRRPAGRGAARRSAWSASRAAARRPSGGCCCASSTPPPARSASTASTSPGLSGAALKPYRRRMQIIFQDPYASLDPRVTDRRQHRRRPAHPRHRHAHGARRQRSPRSWTRSASRPYQARRYPHEFSGGQRQRIGIARALVLKPDLIVCDEPVSALDVSIQAQVLNLLKQLQAEMGLTLVFIAHNMGVVEHISDRVAVMYLGRIVELADRETTLPRPAPPIHPGADVGHPVARPGASGASASSCAATCPARSTSPSGCRFHPRCWLYDRLGEPEDCRDAGARAARDCARPPRRLPLRGAQPGNARGSS